ncbi:hypothetical protein OC846_003742 [Tilletia horrida]|uniref:Amine oxidase domain-containing protein n=1 Tax=Tilletia horrida TaxID=155126 RepID=A0AAN6GPH8_9BASI|nr:hypothetical protein OC845_003588 [Tilletia horrida]KAK0550262.1 hypothetical protein OC846_003742 [Tilletia horrida]
MLQNKTKDTAFVAQAHSARIAIVGAGMSGLLTSLLLESVNVSNYELIEASFRYGGRVHTAPFGDNSWFELGAMRIPHSYMDPSTKERVILKDMQLFFSLVDELNRLNADKPFLQIKLIPWIQSMDGEYLVLELYLNPIKRSLSPLRSAGNLLYSHGIKKDGKAPSIAQIKADPSLTFVDSNPERSKAVAAIAAVTTNNTWARQIADNMFKAHKEWLDSGFEDFSEYQFLRNQGFSVNVSDSITSHDLAGQTLWFEAYDDPYFFADRWFTIDHGMSHLPGAFWGLPGAAKTKLGHQVTGIAPSQDSSKVQVWWQQRQVFPPSSSGAKQLEEYDYAIVSAPFSVSNRSSESHPLRDANVAADLEKKIPELGHAILVAPAAIF